MIAARRRTGMTARRVAVIAALTLTLAGCASKTAGSSRHSRIEFWVAASGIGNCRRWVGRAVDAGFTRRADPRHRAGARSRSCRRRQRAARLDHAAGRRDARHEPTRSGTDCGSGVLDDQAHGGRARVLHSARQHRLGAHFRADPPARRIHQRRRRRGRQSVQRRGAPSSANRPARSTSLGSWSALRRPVS